MSNASEPIFKAFERLAMLCRSAFRANLAALGSNVAMHTHILKPIERNVLGTERCFANLRFLKERLNERLL